MQDKYVGDIGDFGKYALLKHMRNEMDLSLGIVWYLVNPDHADGIPGTNVTFFARPISTFNRVELINPCSI